MQGRFSEKTCFGHEFLDLSEFFFDFGRSSPKNFSWGGYRPPKPPHDQGGSPPTAYGAPSISGHA
jgi:hypothetical protein